jgi:hypothetical protein
MYYIEIRLNAHVGLSFIKSNIRLNHFFKFKILDINAHVPAVMFLYKEVWLPDSSYSGPWPACRLP